MNYDKVISKKINIRDLAKTILIILILLSTFNVQAQIAYDFDPSIDYKKYKSFGFDGEMIIQEGNIDSGSAKLKDRIRRSIMEELEGKGLKYQTQNPDMYISYVAGAENRSQMQDAGQLFAGPGLTEPSWTDNYDEFWFNTYDDGTLVIDLRDGATGQLVYKVYGAGGINKPKKQEREIKKVINKGLKDFPPR